MSDKNTPQEWHPNSDTQVTGEQTTISPISFKLCCVEIAEIMSKPQLKKDRGELICSRLDMLLTKSVGKLEPSALTLFGLDNKAFQNTQNTQNKLKLATIITNEVKLHLDKKLAGEDKEIAFKSIDSWKNSLTAKRQGDTPQPSKKNNLNAPTLPQELDSDTAKEYFARAIEAGLMTKQYKWLKSQSLLACFAREMSLKLCLNKAQNSDGTFRISWRPFEVLFGCPKYSLRTSYNDIVKTGDNPKEIEKVDKIFKD